MKFKDREKEEVWKKLKRFKVYRLWNKICNLTERYISSGDSFETSIVKAFKVANNVEQSKMRSIEQKTFIESIPVVGVSWVHGSKLIEWHTSLMEKHLGGRDRGKEDGI